MSGVNTLEIFVDNIDEVMETFDAIRVKRSTSETGPWEEITASTAQPARMTGTTLSPFNVSSTVLQIQVNSEDQVDITFTGINPISVDQVVSQVNAHFTGLASDSVGHLKLQSLLTGTQSKIYLVGGASIPLLGFEEGQRDIGEEPYVTLEPGVSIYPFYDRDGDGTGDENFYYIVAFYDTGTGLTSAWSEPFEATPGTVIGAEYLSVGSIDLVDITGVSKEGQSISFYPLYEPLKIDAYQIGIVKEPVVITTNNAGHAEVTLVRGMRVKVVFIGTSLIREITVPDTDTFDILELMSAAPDPFNPIYPDYPKAFRRTL